MISPSPQAYAPTYPVIPGISVRIIRAVMHLGPSALISTNYHTSTMQSQILSHFDPILVAKLSKPLKQPSDPHPGGDPHPGDGCLYESTPRLEHARSRGLVLVVVNPFATHKDLDRWQKI
ncbi:hypothetical protein EV426DRAFT_574029 [Tirmania nivea]|nr:hypothetical protein EV426DRAFT_574029 [Tirmania nivea]